MKNSNKYALIWVIALAAAVALIAITQPVMAATQLDMRGNAMKYESTDEYRQWLNKINQLCKQQHNPTEDEEAFWDCLEEETKRDPPPEPHLK